MNDAHKGQQEEAAQLATSARRALERVCSGAGLDPAARYYSPSFVDHVNDLEFRGLAGAEQSVNMYQGTISDIAIAVQEQVVEGNRVVSRFVVTGTSYGRPLRFHGLTLSRFEQGMIVEDWSVLDTMGMLRQMGLWRSLLLGLRGWHKLSAASYRHGSEPASSPHCARG